MNVLLIRLSSLGDVVHTLPALVDAKNAHPELQFDWAVDANFADIPIQHPQVNTIIPVSLRSLRKTPWRTLKSGALKKQYQSLRQKRYDCIIDAQGLIKSALIATCARGKRYGFDRHSIREPLASFFYHHRFRVKKGISAVERNRQLFSKIFGYRYRPTDLDYGLANLNLAPNPVQQHTPYVIFFHGTTWPSKHWPDSYWKTLAQRLTQAGWDVKLPWSNEAERKRAEFISGHNKQVSILPQLPLSDLMSVIQDATACVSVDTGLGHLAAAMTIPTVFIYGSTRAELTCHYASPHRIAQAHFPCAPCQTQRCTYQKPSVVTPACYTTLNPSMIWKQLESLLLP